MAKKQRTFQDRVTEYLARQEKLRDQYGLREDSIIGLPPGQRPGFITKFAVWLLRASGARIQSQFIDLSKK